MRDAPYTPAKSSGSGDPGDSAASWLRDAVELQDADDGALRFELASGAVVSDRFVIDRIAGRGGMGAVYRATDRTSGSPVAVKVISRARGQHADRLSREAEVLSELNHPSIVRYIAHGAMSGTPFLVMEWLEGEDLASRLSHAGLSVDETLTLARRLCEGLAAAHRQGIVHRDLKPSNVFLAGGSASMAKVLDFGIARPANASRPLTRTGAVIGTVGYMAPEQARGTATIDARADVFALGCLLFECLTGQPAFSAHHDVAVLAKVLCEDPPRVSDLRPGLGEGVDALVWALLAKDPDARPKDAQAVLDALDALGAVEGTAPLRERGAGAGLTDSEQRIVTVLLGAARLPVKSGVDVALADTEAGGAPGAMTLDELSQRFGVTTITLRSGGLLLLPSRQGAATDQAARAARCALALRVLRPDLRLALATGRAETTGRVPVGVAIDRAADLLANPDTVSGVALDEVTAGLLGARFEVEGHGEARVLLADQGDLETPRLLMGKPTPCVGREKELGLLESTFAECVNDEVARVLLVTAPPGTGKSRLMMEFVERLRAKDTARVLFARPDPIASGSALSLAHKLVRHGVGLRDGDPAETQVASLRAWLEGRVAADALDRVTEFLGEMVGAPASSPSPLLRAARNDAEVMREQMRRAFTVWIDAEAKGGPLLVILEDLHWGDVPSVGLLDEALKRLAQCPFMVLALGRPEVYEQFPRLWSAVGMQDIRLGGLTKRAAERLVRAILGDAADAEQIARAVERADGNAFYLEELIRCVAEGSAGLPESVLAMAQSRLERLEPEARRVLRAASAFGETCWSGAVTALLGAEIDAAGWLEALADRELLVRCPESRFPAEREFLFRHALLHDAAYAMLTDDDRVLAHGRAGAWLEGVGEKEARVVADHFDRGDLAERAIPWFVRATRAALDGDDFPAVMALAKRGLDLGATGVERGELLALDAIPKTYRNEPPLDQLAEALDLLPEGSGIWWAAIAARLWGAMASGRIELVATLLLRALSADPREITGTHGLSLNSITASLVVVGQAQAAWVLIDHFQRVASRQSEVDPVFLGYLDASRAMAAIHGRRDGARQLEGARASAHAAIEGMAACGSAAGETMAVIGFAQASMQLGRYEDAALACQRTIRMAREIGFTLLDDAARVTLAWNHFRTGQPCDAPTLLASAFESKDVTMAACARAFGAGVLLAEGSKTSVDAALRDALAVAKESPFVLAHCAALSVAAHAYFSKGQFDETLAAIAKGMRHAGAVPPDFEVDLLTLRAEVLERRGDRAGAREAIRQARKIVLDVAENIHDPDLRQSYLTGVPINARALALATAWQVPT